MKNPTEMRRNKAKRMRSAMKTGRDSGWTEGGIGTADVMLIIMPSTHPNSTPFS